MKVTVVQLMTSAMIVRELANQKLPFGVSWKIKEIRDAADEVLKAFEERRQEIIKDTGAKLEEKGKKYTWPSKKKEQEAQEALDKEANSEVDLKATPLSFADMEATTIESDAIPFIEWMIIKE